MRCAVPSCLFERGPPLCATSASSGRNTAEYRRPTHGRPPVPRDGTRPGRHRARQLASVYAVAYEWNQRAVRSMGAGTPAAPTWRLRPAAHASHRPSGLGRWTSGRGRWFGLLLRRGRCRRAHRGGVFSAAVNFEWPLAGLGREPGPDGRAVFIQRGRCFVYPATSGERQFVEAHGWTRQRDDSERRMIHIDQQPL
jgi:hypothetical protein